MNRRHAPILGQAGYSAQHIREASAHLQRLLEVLSKGKLSEEDMEFHLEEAISLLAGAWHARWMGHDLYGNLTSEEIAWMRRSIPNFRAFKSEPYQLVDIDERFDANPGTS